MRTFIIIAAVCLVFIFGFFVCAIFASTKIAKLEQEIHELKRGN